MIADLPHDLQGGTVFQNDESVRPVDSRLRGNDGRGTGMTATQHRSSRLRIKSAMT